VLSFQFRHSRKIARIGIMCGWATVARPDWRLRPPKNMRYQILDLWIKLLLKKKKQNFANVNFWPDISLAASTRHRIFSATSAPNRLTKQKAP
jgi:hypothetical protein